MVGQMETGKAVKALSALAQEHRLAAYRLLVQAGAEGLMAGVIAEKLSIAPSSLSFHLSQLSNAGLVTQRRESRSIYYAADYAAMNTLMSFMLENCCGGVSCISDVGCSAEQSSNSERNAA